MDLFHGVPNSFQYISTYFHIFPFPPKTNPIYPHIHLRHTSAANEIPHRMGWIEPWRHPLQLGLQLWLSRVLDVSVEFDGAFKRAKKIKRDKLFFLTSNIIIYYRVTMYESNFESVLSSQELSRYDQRSHPGFQQHCPWPVKKRWCFCQYLSCYFRRWGHIG